MEEKNTNKILIVVIFVLIFAFAGYVTYNIVSKKPETNNEGKVETNEAAKVEELNIKSNFIKELYEKISFKGVSCEPLEYNLKSDTLKVTDFTDAQKLLIAVANVKSYHIEEENGHNMISEKNMQEAFYDVFGKNVAYSTLMPKEGSDLCPVYIYNASKKAYIDQGACGNVCPVYQKEQLIKALKYSDKLELYTASAFCGESQETQGACFADSNRTVEIGNQDVDLIQFKDKLPNYKYTLTYDEETGNYYYYSVEKISK